MISTVVGSFKKFDATMEASDKEFKDAVLKFSADVESIFTGVADRDSHLKSSDVFNVQQWPKITFESTDVVKTSSWSYEVVGNLTIKDVTLPVKLLGTCNGVVTDGSHKLGHVFELHGTLSRKDYGLNFNLTGLGGNILVDDTIRLAVNVVAVEANDEL